MSRQTVTLKTLFTAKKAVCFYIAKNLFLAKLNFWKSNRDSSRCYYYRKIKNNNAVKTVVPLVLGFYPSSTHLGSKVADFIVVLVGVRASCQHLEYFPGKSMRFIMLISSFPVGSIWGHFSMFGKTTLHLTLFFIGVQFHIACEFLLCIVAFMLLDTISLFCLLSLRPVLLRSRSACLWLTIGDLFMAMVAGAKPVPRFSSCASTLPCHILCLHFSSPLLWYQTVVFPSTKLH